MSKTAYRSNKTNTADDRPDTIDYATGATTAEGFASVGRTGADELRWSMVSGKAGRSGLGEPRDGGGGLRTSGFESLQTGVGRSNERSEFGNNTSLKGKKNAQQFLDDIMTHEKRVSSTASKNRNQQIDGPKKYSSLSKGAFSFSKGRHNDITPDEDLMAELAASNTPKELDNNNPVEDSFFKEELFKPTINARSLEIAEANPKWKRIDKRFREEVERKVKKIKQLAKQVAQERKDKESEAAKRSSSTKSLKSKNATSKAPVEGMDAYSRNKIWADQKRIKLELAQKQQKIKELEQEQTLKGSRIPITNQEDPNILVARKAGTGSHLSQMAFPLRQQTHQARRAEAISTLAASLQAKSCPFAPRTHTSSQKPAKNPPAVEVRATAASQLRTETAKARIERIRTQLEERKAAEIESQLGPPNRNEGIAQRRTPSTSPHLCRPAVVRKLFVDVKGGVSPSASVATKLYRSTFRDTQRSPQVEKRLGAGTPHSRSESKLRLQPTF